MELPEEVWFEVLRFVPPEFDFVLEDVCGAWREFVRARTPEFRGPPWCRLRPPRVDVGSLARQGHWALLEAAERAGKFSWADSIYNTTDGWYITNAANAIRNAAQCGHTALVHQLLVRLPSDTRYVQTFKPAALGGHSTLFFELVEQYLDRFTAIAQTKRTEIYRTGLWNAAQGEQWSLVYQLLDLVGLDQCKLGGGDTYVLNQAIKSGNIEVYSYLSKRLGCAPRPSSAVWSGSVEMLEAVIADGYTTLEVARKLVHLSPNVAMFDALGAPPNSLDECFVQSRTAELARALLARGARVAASTDIEYLVDRCRDWWYCELVFAVYLEAMPDRTAALDRTARNVAEYGDNCSKVHRHRLANLVKLGAAPRSLSCVCSRR